SYGSDVGLEAAFQSPGSPRSIPENGEPSRRRGSRCSTDVLGHGFSPLVRVDGNERPARLHGADSGHVETAPQRSRWRAPFPWPRELTESRRGVAGLSQWRTILSRSRGMPRKTSRTERSTASPSKKRPRSRDVARTRGVRELHGEAMTD